MASTNKTSNLQLSQFIATDTPTWLVDYNGDMEKIDAGVGRVEELAETASTQAVGVASGLQTTNQTVTTLSGQVANVQNQANTTTASVNGINQRLGNANISGIGDGTITGAIISMQNSTVTHYNPDTDYLDIYYNSELVGSLYVGFKDVTFTLNDGRTSWVMVKEITGLSSGQYTFTATANRTDSGAHDNKNAIGLSATLVDNLTDYNVENSNKQLECTKTFNISSASDKIYVYIYNANAAYTYSGRVSITKNN